MIQTQDLLSTGQRPKSLSWIPTERVRISWNLLRPLGNAAFLPPYCQGSKWLNDKSVWLVFRRSWAWIQLDPDIVSRGYLFLTLSTKTSSIVDLNNPNHRGMKWQMLLIGMCLWRGLIIFLFRQSIKRLHVVFCLKLTSSTYIASQEHFQCKRSSNQVYY